MYYMYIIALLKNPRFNPDTVLIVKLIWNNHPKMQKLVNHYSVWPCLYALDKESADGLIDGKFNRNLIVNSQILKYFELNINTEKLTIKSERAKEIQKYLSILPYEKRLWRDLGKWWNIDIDCEEIIKIR